MSLQTKAEKQGIPFTPSLKAAIYDGNAFSVMVGAGEGYLSAYAISLLASPFQLGLLASLSAFWGAVGQLIGLWSLQFITSRRKLIVKAALINGLVLIPVGLLAFVLSPGERTAWWLLGLTALYFLTNGLGGPAWNSLIGDLVPEEKRGSYFGFRNRYMGLCTFVGMIGAGQLLDLFTRFGESYWGYLVIFLIAAGSRLVSCFWLSKYEDIPPQHGSGHHFTFWQFLARSRHSNFARFVIYVSIVNGAVAFSGPFFTVHMLRNLNFSYLEFTCAAAATTAVQFLTMQHWGKLMDLFGSKKVLNLLGFAVAFAPVLWLGSGSFWYVMFVQFYSGAVWAGFNLAAATFLFDAVTPAKRARCSAYQAVVNGVCVLIGAASGGLLASHLPSSVSLLGFEWTPVTPLFFLFIISGVLRLIAAAFLLPQFSEVSAVEPIRHRDLLFRITGLRPISGMSFDLVAGLPKWRRAPEQPKRKL